MKIPALGFCGLVAAEIFLRGQIGGLPAPAWQDIRKAQPDGLVLRMTLPKDHFYQGEIIDASLAFSNTSTAPYHLWIGNYDRSGRIPDIAFHAQDAGGKEVPDPLAWYFMMGGMGGGLGNEQDLGTWTISLPVNQWLRFDKPGIYTLYAWSNRVQKGGKEQRRSSDDAVGLVSDKMQITIDPLPPETEKQIIAQAREKIALGGEVAGPAVDQLRYLETPAARAELVPLLTDQRVFFPVMMGLCAAPDPAAEAETLLNEVSQGKLTLRADITNLYSMLKMHDLMATFSPASVSPQDAQQLGQKINQARDEITAAALKASGGKGDAYIGVLLTKFQQNNRDPAIRADLVQHQLELSDEQANGLLESWDYVGGEEFLPLARKMAAAPSYNMAALKALAKAKPDEAQVLLVADARESKSNYFTPRYGSISMHRLPLKPVPMPELDAVLREKLGSDARIDVTLFYVEQYGTPALLPDVIKLYLQHEGKWACEVQKFALIYWIRCDPKGGTEALARALQARTTTGCYKRVLEDVLGERWDAAALPVVVQALDDPNNEVAFSAVKVLELHADATYIDKTIAALERINNATANGASTPGTVMRGQASNVARQLLESKNWHYSPEQQQRLQAIDKGH